MRLFPSPHAHTLIRSVVCAPWRSPNCWQQHSHTFPYPPCSSCGTRFSSARSAIEDRVPKRRSEALSPSQRTIGGSSLRHKRVHSKSCSCCKTLWGGGAWCASAGCVYVFRGHLYAPGSEYGSTNNSSCLPNGTTRSRRKVEMKRLFNKRPPLMRGTRRKGKRSKK